MVTIRQIRDKEELEKCYDLWGQVFQGNETRDFFANRLNKDSSYKLTTTWIAKVDNDIASSVQIFPYEMRIGKEKLLVGGIGSVATNRLYRGKGYAQEILHAQNLWMHQNKYDLSLLFSGIGTKFYEEVGYKKVKNVAYQAKKLPKIESDLLFAKDDDMEMIQKVYQEYNREKTNSCIRSSQYWKDQIAWRGETKENFCVIKEDREIKAYLRFENKKGKTSVLEACYLPGAEMYMTKLFHQFCASAYCLNDFTIMLPNDHILTQNREKIEEGTHMWRFFDFQNLMHKLEPVFNERMPNDKKIVFRCEEDCVVLNRNKVEVTGHNYDYDERILVTKKEFFELLTQGYQATENQKLRNNSIIQKLFPPQNGILWQSDFF
ncbi:GNAT family N-acetyltransferase [Pullulanibacillus sp. KACC 23026]|uniref:GNAT family N-acetyltransferase n=1 Tax=Pullulanibacillus sp. KACC 23026 TaxID=3028315 RepID=UPI0023AFC9AB|nr:GNAT family N-acetyltransferase [Pullulanibacillus sp. KACC 23026]WEG10770.1 GNAT family N-acetyltransferase [Pullulanibacillus sp. KACC 23026]